MNKLNCGKEDPLYRGCCVPVTGYDTIFSNSAVQKATD